MKSFKYGLISLRYYVIDSVLFLSPINDERNKILLMVV